MAAVNATQIWNTTEYITFINNINTASGNVFINSFLIGIFIICLYLMKNYDNMTAALASSAITAVFSIIIGWTGIGSGSYVIAGFVIFLLALIVYRLYD